MKHTLLLFALVLFLASCDKEQNSDDKSWQLDSIEVLGDPIPIIDGLSFSPQFTIKGEDIDYSLNLNEANQTWSTSGGYTLETEYEPNIIPDGKESFEGISKSGSYTIRGDEYEFEEPLLEIKINDVDWMGADGESLKYVYNRVGDILIQDQNFMNVKVKQGLNANLVVRTKWKKK